MLDLRPCHFPSLLVFPPGTGRCVMIAIASQKHHELWSSTTFRMGLALFSSSNVPRTLSH
jgi:hypothetical protein